MHFLFLSGVANKCTIFCEIKICAIFIIGSGQQSPRGLLNGELIRRREERNEILESQSTGGSWLASDQDEENSPTLLLHPLVDISLKIL